MLNKMTAPGGAGASSMHTHIKSHDSNTVKREVRGHWRTILTSLGILPEHLTGRHGACPVDGGKDGFRFDDKNGDGTYFCNRANRAGDGFDLLMHVYGWSFSESLQAVTMRGDNPATVQRAVCSSNTTSYVPDQKVWKYVEWLWSHSLTIAPNTPPYLYFQSRFDGLYADLACESKSLRWHPSLKFRDEEVDGKYPAVVAKVLDSNEKMVALRRIYLNRQGQKLSGNCKRLTPSLFPGANRGAAIRLFPIESDGQLIIGEGIETTLAAIHLWGAPGWAAGDAGLMESIIVPRDARSILIVVDNDSSGRGESAARKLGARLQQEGRSVQLIKPSAVGRDIDDLFGD